MRWQDFENSAEKFLKKLSNEKVNIHGPLEGAGGSNANTVDLKIFKNNQLKFNIEIKKCESQISQFVVKKDEVNSTFNLGNLKSPAEYKTVKILDHMRKNYEYYKFPSRSGIKLKCEDSLIYECIDDYLKEKDIEFILTSDKENNFFLVHKNKFKKNFKVYGSYRLKKSGTRHIPKNRAVSVINFLKQKFQGASLRNDNKGVIINFNGSTSIRKNEKINFEDSEYHLSKIQNTNTYYIKIKSKTNNPTVIFTIELISKPYNEDNTLYLEMIN